ncbi:MAG: DUF6362 family protein [Reyranella sp.]|nr:DUF6362 family protein [Reyranella sp.]
MAAELTFTEVRRAVITALDRAANTLKRLPMPRNGMPARERSSWPAGPLDPGDTCDHSSSMMARIPPGPKAISELDRVLPWLAALDTRDRRIVWARAGGLSWARLAREFGISVGRARYRWNVAIDLVVTAAVRDTIKPGGVSASRRRSCQTARVAR